MPQKSTFIIIIYKETDLHWQWPMQVCYLETIFTASFFIDSHIQKTIIKKSFSQYKVFFLIDKTPMCLYTKQSTQVVE